MRVCRSLLCLSMMVIATALPAHAGSGKLLLTGGVSSIDGAAGGGLTPWAVIGSNATAGEWGASVHATRVSTGDYSLNIYGVLVAWNDRFELSLARQQFNAADNLAPLGLKALQLEQDLLGFKLRLAGDAVLDSDNWMPQVAIGAIYRHARPAALGPTLTGPLGARLDGVDVYVSATKLLLERGVLVNATLRATRANQNGLLGFGGALSSGTTLQPEVSLAWLLSSQLALGAEYRAKPNGLQNTGLGGGALKEDDWWDLFLAWAPNKRFSLTLAYVDLGRIAPAVQPRRQTGAYVSAQLAF